MRVMAKKPFIIGIAGGTCCGKTEVCRKIIQRVTGDTKHGNKKVITLPHTSFYRHFTEEERQLAENGKFNFDHPNAFDDEMLLKVLKQLKSGESATIHKYDYNTHQRENQLTTIPPADVILLEGILVLYNKDIREQLDMKIFVDTDCDTRLARRVLRDTVERKRDIDSVLNQYTTFVKRSFEEFAWPTKRYADVIIPRGADNEVAVDVIVQHIEDILGSSAPTRRRTISENSANIPH
jgi:uridine kinase